MRNKTKYLALLLGLLVLIITSIGTVYAKYSKETPTKQFHLQINAEPIAFAVYGEVFDENGTSQGIALNFYRRADVPEIGDDVALDATETTVTAYQKVANVYLDIESDVYATEDAVPWYSVRTNIKEVTFIDEVSPRSTGWWFGGFTNCTKMNLSKLNTSNVTNMTRMFNNCSVLIALDVSFFDTAKVESFSYMFAHCNNLTEITGVGKLVKDSATSLTSMFHSCSSLTALDLSNYETKNVTNMSSMFNSCSKLQTLNISGFNATSATNVSSMFTNCRNLTTLTLGTNFGTSGNTLGAQFNKIDLVSSSSKWKDSDGNILDWSDIPTGKADTYTVYTLYAYATISDDGTTLNVYHDYTYPTDVTVYSYPSGMPSGSRAPLNAAMNWSNDTSARSKITKVVIHNSVSLTSLSRWFLAMKLTDASSIEGLDKLDFASVTSTGSAFYLCSQLKDELVNAVLAKLASDGAKLTDMRMMFSDCTSLTALDMCGLNTASVTHMNSMFSSCTNLTTIIVDDSWSTAGITNGSDMFTGCASLIGGAGTSFASASVKDISYARIDGGSEHPGYLTYYRYAVAFESNGGKGAPDVIINKEGSLTILSGDGSIPIREGYKFLGWATTTDATTAEYQSGDTIDCSAETVPYSEVLYAVWEKETLAGNTTFTLYLL